MNGKKIEWWYVLWVLANNISMYQFLLVDFSMYRKKHPRVKSFNRIAYYVLRKNYSTTSIYCLAFCADHIGEYLEWLEEYGL